MSGGSVSGAQAWMCNGSVSTPQSLRAQSRWARTLDLLARLRVEQRSSAAGARLAVALRKSGRCS